MNKSVQLQSVSVVLAFLLQISSSVLAQPEPALIPMAQPADVQSEPHQSAATYRIGPGDILEIVVWKEEGLAKEVVVSPDGFISFPLVGSIKAEGRTVDQIKEELEKRLGEIIFQPVATVSLKSYASYKIYVTGKVNQPGEWMITESVDVMQALSKAGGLARFADEDSIKILRKVGGKLVAIPFDYSEVVDGEALEQNITLQDGDVIVVP